MISAGQMLPLLVEACPSFRNTWEAHKLEYQDDENFLPYVAMGEFAHHMVELYGRNDVSCFEAVFGAIERFHRDGDAYAKEAATIGCLEGLQNVAGNRGIEPAVFYKYLGPISAKCWDELNRFWNGEVKYVGESFIEKCQN